MATQPLKTKTQNPRSSTSTSSMAVALAISKEQLMLPSKKDLDYEEEVLRNPYNLKLWWRYLIDRQASEKRLIIYERALKALPGSYKLWNAYLLERLEQVRSLPPTHPKYEALNRTFERALITMHKMPRIWRLYLQTLTDQKLLTRTRRTFDRALCALPVTQHHRIWAQYLQFASQEGVPIETSLRIHRRYLKFDPSHIEDFVTFLLNSKLWTQAAHTLAEIVNDDKFNSIKGKTKHELWLQLCDLLTNHATEVFGFNVDAILRAGITKYNDQVGTLWVSLADYYIRRGLFEKARDIFEEGMLSVITVRDFTLVFDAYSSFEETSLAAKMETIEGKENEDEINLRLARMEILIQRRPELVSSVLLRQNPHNVEQWHKRVKLFDGNPAKQILTYTEAVRTVDPVKAVGKSPHTLWISFAKLYEAHDDILNARVIFDKAVQVNYTALDHLASIWCEWVEMELRQKNFKTSLNLIKRATAEPSLQVRSRVAADGNEEPVQMKSYKSLRLWTLYVDLEESLGNLESTCAVYERIIELKISTPQIIINYALLLEEHNFFEDSFKVYERGVGLFKYPHVKDIWATYLAKFVKRHGNKKLERTREMFEHAIESTPSEYVKPLFLQYAKLEEDYGLAKRAMNVYDQAVQTVPVGERMGIYETYIARAAEMFGVPRTRDIYKQAIQFRLPDKDAKVMSIKYAELEKSLGEIDRARAIYVYSSQYTDPTSDTDFWTYWHEFEVGHGNEESFKEMLRVKRSVSSIHSQIHLSLLGCLIQKDKNSNLMKDTMDTVKRVRVPQDEMIALENQVSVYCSEGARKLGFVSAGVIGTPPGGRRVTAYPEDIDLPQGSDSDEEKVEVSYKVVPHAVYGDLTMKVEGALERIKRQRVC